MSSRSERFAEPPQQFATVNEQLVAALRNRILSGDLAPGSALPEVRLAGEFGVSRNTLREAVRGLANEGLVEQNRHRTATVVDLTGDDAVDLIAVQRLLELTALERLEAAWPEETSVVDAAFEALWAEAGQAGSGTGSGAIAAELEFHRSVVALHRSPRLLRSFERIKYELAVCKARIADDQPGLLAPDVVLAEYGAIRDAVVGQDSALAYRLVSEHLDSYEAAARRVLPDLPQAGSAEPV